MDTLFKTVSIITIAFIFVATLPSPPRAQATNNLQVILETEGNFFIEWFEVTYQIDSSVRTHYTIRLNTLEEDNPFINVDIRVDEIVYERDKPIFDQAELMIWSTLFSMEDGSSERVYFSSFERYHGLFTPTLHKPENYSIQYLCSYSLNLSQSIDKAKKLFANATGYGTADQSNLECIISFGTIGLAQGISVGGQERQLRFDFVCMTHELEHFSFSFFVPDDFAFIGEQTLNGKEMYKTPSHVFGVDWNERGYDSLGNPFWMCGAVVNWQVPGVAALWETHPVDWIISALIGFLISTSVIYAKKRLWKPKLLVKTIARPWVHPQTGIAFYRLAVRNKGRTTAHDCKIHITFKDSNRTELFSLSGKWDKLPEPLGPIQAGGVSNVWPALIPFTESLSIRPDESDTFCLVLKDNEDVCYAYNAYSYLHDYKNPQWQLPIGKYFVDVHIRSENAKKHQSFLIRNNGSNAQDVVISKLNR